MNNIFIKAKKNKIVIDKNFYMKPDGFSGVVLVHSQQKKRKKKTGGEEFYKYETKFYYPRVAQALQKYVDVSGSSDMRIDKILENSKRVLTIISEFDKNSINSNN